MTGEREILLRRLEHLPEIDRRVVELLSREDTRQVGDSSHGGTVHATLGIWRVRAEINEEDGHPLLGASELVSKLKELPPQLRVTQISFDGAEYSCNLFFEKTSSRFLGFVLAKRRTPKEEQLRVQRFLRMTGQTDLRPADGGDAEASRVA